MSSQVMIPAKNTIVIATNATAVGLKSKPMEGNAQPIRARINTTAKIFSDIFIDPNLARPSAANFLLSIFTASGRSIQ